MEKITYRFVPTNFWRDPTTTLWTPEDRYFWLCITTNDRTSSCGVYAISVRELAFLSLYSEDAVRSLLQRFVEYGQILYNKETAELALRDWFHDHPIQNPNMATGAIKESEAVKDKTLLNFVNFGPSVEVYKKLPEKTLAEGFEGVPEGFGNSLSLSSRSSLDSPQENLERASLGLEINSARDEAPAPVPPPDPASGPGQEGGTKLERLLLDIEATGKHRSSKFALTPLVREKFVTLAQVSTTAAAKAWADFLREKGPKLYVAQVIIEDLPEFLDKRIRLLAKPPPTSVYPDTGNIHRKAGGVLAQQADADPVTDEHLRDTEEFLKQFRPRGRAS